MGELNSFSTPGTVRELICSGESDSIALMAPDRSPLSYRLLREQIELTATQLRELGVGKKDRVAIVLPNGPDMAAAFLGICSAAVAAPLNPAFGQADFEFYLQDLDIRLLLVEARSQSESISAATKLGISVATLSSNAEAGSFNLEGTTVGGDPSDAKDCTSEDIAMLLHTSGTTSRPKIVPLTHANLVASAQHVRETLLLTKEDRCLNIMPLFHIHGLVAALLGSIGVSASICCNPGFEASQFFDSCREFHPNWYTAVPTMHQAILGHATKNEGVSNDTCFRFIRSSSASLPPTTMQALEEAFDAPVIEAYGMTEAAHQMCCNPLPPQTRKPGAVGPAAGPEVAIMNSNGVLLPNETVGEVVIRGKNVTAGYLGNEEANATAFENGWFRTGDQGIIDADNYLRLTGRLKEIINRGGEKISPREIDESFMEHPSVAQAVAFAVPHTTLGEDIAVAIVLRPSANETPQELREYAFAQLAPFKVPSQVVIVEQIPKGPTGKLKRIGLHELLSEQLRPEFASASNEFEVIILSIWLDVLPTETIGIHDNFFGLGGDSLSAAVVASRIASQFELELKPEGIFRFPTIAAHAVVIEDLLLSDIEASSQEDA